MPLFAALLLPLVLSGAAPAAPAVVPVAHEQATRPAAGPSSLSDSAPRPEWIDSMRRPESAEQVRIEGRVILRISPRPSPSNDDLLRRLMPPESRDGPFTRMVERPAPRCVATRDIVGATDRGNRLMLFLRDNRILMASLEKTCSPRDFYRGFSLERNEDGKMCAGRDTLMSRSGAHCALRGLTELVPVTFR